MIDTTQIPVRSSHLKAMASSAAKCLDAMTADSESSAAQKRGTALHAALLGNVPVVTLPEDLKRPTAAQRNAKKPSPQSVEQIARWDEFQREHANSYVLTPAKYSEVMRMADAVRADPFAAEVLDLGSGRMDYETTLRCKYLGRDCRMTPDALAHDRGVDLKSTKDASVSGFPWQFKRYGYHGQLAFYNHAAPRENWYTVAVEPPRAGSSFCAVTVFRVPDDVLELGERFNRLQMEKLIACERAGSWPSYAQGIVDLVWPSTDDFELDFGDDDETETEADGTVLAHPPGE